MRIFQEPNGLFGTEHFGDGRLDTDVIAFVVGEVPHQVRQRFHCKQGRGHAPDSHLLRLALGQRFLESVTSIHPIESWLPGLLGHAETECRNTDGSSDVQDR